MCNIPHIRIKFSTLIYLINKALHSTYFPARKGTQGQFKGFLQRLKSLPMIEDPPKPSFEATFRAFSN